MLCRLFAPCHANLRLQFKWSAQVCDGPQWPHIHKFQADIIGKSCYDKYRRLIDFVWRAADDGEKMRITNREKNRVVLER